MEKTEAPRPQPSLRSGDVPPEFSRGPPRRTFSALFRDGAGPSNKPASPDANPAVAASPEIASSGIDRLLARFDRLDDTNRRLVRLEDRPTGERDPRLAWETDDGDRTQARFQQYRDNPPPVFNHGRGGEGRWRRGAFHGHHTRPARRTVGAAPPISPGSTARSSCRIGMVMLLAIRRIWISPSPFMPRLGILLTIVTQASTRALLFHQG